MAAVTASRNGGCNCGSNGCNGEPSSGTYQGGAGQGSSTVVHPVRPSARRAPPGCSAAARRPAWCVYGWASRGPAE
eukprot:scaffold1928_cov103-Isochrysis_galbana.AAC.2